MKFLVALALLVLAVAEAHHTAEHKLRGPRFSPGKLHVFKVQWNATAQVPGLNSQVSKSAFRAKLLIEAKSETEHYLKITNVETSGAVRAVSGSDGDVDMRSNKDLEDKLSLPIRFTLENGEVTSYTLDPQETLESKKIKKSFLRSLEMYVPKEAIIDLEAGNIPVTYNVTEPTPFGLHRTYYLITVSPNVEFPYSDVVYNISRLDDVGEESYPSYYVQNNFAEQGCSEVCRKDCVNKTYGAGCPEGYQPYKSPMKTFMHHLHHLRLEDGIMTPEVIDTTEKHDAKMYDQDMKVLIRVYMKKDKPRAGHIEDPSGDTYTDINEQEPEINLIEIDKLCGYKGARDAADAAIFLLENIAAIIEKGDLDNSESTMIGEKIILLKNALSKLEVPHFETVVGSIKRLGDLRAAPDIEKIKRQIWMDILPVIGTNSSVTFIVNYIKGNLKREVMIWEAKEILEAMPQNIHYPNQKTIEELQTLLELEEVQKVHLLHSAVYTCLGRVIGRVCDETDSEYGLIMNTFSRRSEGCPKETVDGIIKYISYKLSRTTKKEAILTYIQTLAFMRVDNVLPVISKYALGTAENIQSFTEHSIEFIRSATLFSLHSLAGKQRRSVMEVVVPMFFNETESPKLRTAAFGVLMRCEPPVGLLQQVAFLSWREKSKEVGSYVTSTWDTYGNSSIPCMVHISHRIKQVMPMLRRSHIGVQHAQNLLWTYFDDIRDFGLNGHLAYIPSNESIVPNAMYHDLTYSTGSLSDTVMQTALHIQGLTERKIMEKVASELGISPPEYISPQDEQFIFEQARIAKYIPEQIRYTIYSKRFYSTSYYYLDEHNKKTQEETFKEYYRHYVTRSSYDHDGHLVKLYVPSSFHTKTVAYALPYPVEFQMLQPVVMAMKIKSLERNPTAANFRFAFRPSVYLSKLFTNQIKNIGDCKEVGVYHEHKIALSLPFEIKFEVKAAARLITSYKLPDLPKKILYYHTEAGTFAGKKSYLELPSSVNREPIRTLESPFQFSQDVNIIGLPPVKMNLLSEDIQLRAKMVPRNQMEAVHMMVKRVLNAGWRYKAANITLRDDSKLWPRDTEVTFKIEYNRAHVIITNPKQDSAFSRKESSRLRQDSPWARQDSLWSSQDPTPSEDQPEDYTKGTEWVKNFPVLIAERSHISHKLNVEMKTKPVSSGAYAKFDYTLTHSRSKHVVRIDAGIKTQEESTYRKKTFMHCMEFFEKPDEFRYDLMTDRHYAEFGTIFLNHVCDDCPWKGHILLKGRFYYKTLDSILNKELENKVDHIFFLPEKHQECIEDVKDGHPMSENCLKALRERTIYNKLRMWALWDENLPASFKNASVKFDTLFKYLYYDHMTVKYEENPEHRLWISVDHINKFTDRQVFDAVIQKPEETIYLRRAKTLPYAFGRTLSSVYDYLELDMMEHTNNTYPPTCGMMKNYVSTYDLRSYPLDRLDRCKYVLTAHCTQYKNFAIITKILSKDGEKEVNIFVGSHSMILTPMKGSDYEIVYDGQHYTVSDVLVFNQDTADIYVYSEEYSSHHKHLTVVAAKAGVRVTYDGENVKVQIDPRYKGETCGLCSEFDGEVAREYKGLDGCLYSHPDDFVNSAITNREDRCEKEILYPYHCDSKNISRSMVFKRGESKSDEYEPTLKRNVIIAKGNDICFSVRAVPVCEEHAHPTETAPKSMGFHCLPKQDITARRLVSEAKRRSLGELENKSVDYEEPVEVAKMCSE